MTRDAGLTKKSRIEDNVGEWTALEMWPASVGPLLSKGEHP
jgi:hypothetical protein